MLNTVVFFSSPSNRLATWRWLASLSAAVASSRKTHSGLCRRSRAKARRSCSPSESSLSQRSTWSSLVVRSQTFSHSEMPRSEGSERLFWTRRGNDEMRHCSCFDHRKGAAFIRNSPIGAIDVRR